MNTLKRLAAVLLVGIMILSVSACHPKDETALTIGDVKITSALYMCALINADSEAKTKIDEEKADETSSDTSTTTETTDYYSEKIDDKDFTTWVKDRALEICLEYAAYETKAAENNLTLTEDQQTELDRAVEYYWSYYGYSTLYEPNGVGKETFKRSIKSSYLASAYFLSIYDTDGTNPVSADEVKTAIEGNFVIADVLTVSLSSQTDDEKATLKTKFEDYEKKLKSGTSFEDIYNDYYEIEEDTSSSSDTSSTDETKTPEDKYATVLGSEDTDYSDDNYATVKEMAINEVKLVETDDALTLLVRKDLFGDEYWVENLNTPALTLLKGDEFDADVEEFTKTLTVKKNNYAINRFNVKKIVYPTSN